MNYTTIILASLTVLLLSHVVHCLWFDRKQLSLKEEVKELKDVILTLESMESKAIARIGELETQAERRESLLRVADAALLDKWCVGSEEEWPEIIGG